MFHFSNINLFHAGFSATSVFDFNGKLLTYEVFPPAPSTADICPFLHIIPRIVKEARTTRIMRIKTATKRPFPSFSSTLAGAAALAGV